MTLPLEKYCIEADLGTQILIFLYTSQISLSLEEIRYNEKENNTNSLEATMVRFMLLGSTCMHALQVIVIICRHSLRQTAELMGIVSMQNEEGYESTK